MGLELTSKDLGEKIHVIRGHRVMLDSDLAELYEVSAKRLNQQVMRNRERFPADFMFQLTKPEYEILRLQFATLRLAHGTHRKYLPFVFTEQGVAMLSNVLRSERAVQVNIAIMRAFVKLRELQATDQSFAKKLTELERKFFVHDKQLKVVFAAIRKLLGVESQGRRRIKGLGGR